MTEYLQWQSKLSLAQVFAQGESFSYPTPLGNGFLYLSNLKEQGNRSVLMFKQSHDSNVPSICITPDPFNLRTKINEYGGKPFWLFGNTVYFANLLDQCLYQQNIDFDTGVASTPNVVSPQTTKQQSFMFADLVRLQHPWLLAVVETSNDDSFENVHSINALKHDSPDSEMIQLVEGASFFSNLVVSPDGARAAWVQWDHPAMPWDETQLWVADICLKAGQPSFVNQRRIEFVVNGSIQAGSVCQLIYANNGYLFFSIDFQNAADNDSQNYWNIMCYKFDDKAAQTVTSALLEFGYPHWQYGDARIVQLNDDHLLTFGTVAEGDQLYTINQNTLAVQPFMATSLTHKNLQNLSADSDGTAMAVMLSADANPSLVALHLDDAQQQSAPQILLSNTSVLNKGNVSSAEHFSFITRDKANAYGYYYPPVNADYKHDTAPPLIVMIHGGPTARAYGYFDIQKQFWTNRGFAVFDVNPRGSTGYGRAYRDDLYGQWGIIDINDIIDGIEHLTMAGKANQDKVCIRGKSSGGYAVLRALTEYPEVFQAGACYYGIGNLATLAQVTHKFEKHYTDQLIGENYDATTAQQPTSLFYQRSPIHKVAQLRTSMIIFQGLEDKIVPPSVSQEVVSVLEKTGLTYAYVEYADEGHGFKQVHNNIDAWTRELAFYQTILSNPV